MEGAIFILGLKKYQQIIIFNDVKHIRFFKFQYIRENGTIARKMEKEKNDKKRIKLELQGTGYETPTLIKFKEIKMMLKNICRELYKYVPKI